MKVLQKLEQLSGIHLKKTARIVQILDWRSSTPHFHTGRAAAFKTRCFSFFPVGHWYRLDGFLVPLMANFAGDSWKSLTTGVDIIRPLPTIFFW